MNFDRKSREFLSLGFIIETTANEFTFLFRFG